MEAIIFNEVSKVFDNGEIGVEKLSFRINRGEFVLLSEEAEQGKARF